MTIENALLVYGPLGVTVAWFMLRTDKKLDGIEVALSRLTRALLLAVVTRSDVPPAMKLEARAMLDEFGPTEGRPL